ncbi:MAG TPA: cell envelope integrity protein TolA [Burkholderiales bacterium]
MSRLAANGPQPDPGAGKSLLLALVVHVAFFAFLVFAVSWRTEPPQGMVAELWTSIPSAAPQPAPPPPPPPEPEVKPEPPKPAPPPEPRAETKPEPKPDIALKEKQEQEKKKREEAEKKQEAEKKRQEAEKEKRQLEQQKAAEAERLKREQAKQQQELARLAREQEALNQQLQAQAAAGQSRLLDDYKGRIKAKIQGYIVLPPEIPGNPEAHFDVVLLPSGEVLSVKLKKSSGHAAYDQAVERAILKAQPLPLPPDPALFANFRNLELRFRPRE